MAYAIDVVKTNIILMYLIPLKINMNIIIRIVNKILKLLYVITVLTMVYAPIIKVSYHKITTGVKDKRMII